MSVKTLLALDFLPHSEPSHLWKLEHESFGLFKQIHGLGSNVNRRG
jgi:hypothetical protein